MSFPRYPKYKDSGVEWLGEVPEHWDVAPFKRNIEHNDGGVWGEEPDGIQDSIVLRSTEQTVDGRWQINDPASRKLSNAEQAAALLATGDLLVTKASGSSLHIGKTTLVTAEIAALRCCFSNFMQRIRTTPSLSPELVWFVMNSRIARLQFDYLSSSTTGLANLTGTMIGNIWLPVPPRKEQDAIVAFLNAESARLDTLIIDQQRLIALLREKQQAIIAHAVTKGLNRSASMSPSSIAGLEDLPSHWQVLPLRRLVDQKRPITYGIVQPGEPDPNGRFMIRGQDYSSGWVPYEQIFRVSDGIERPYKRARLKQDDLLMTIVGAGVGNIAVVPDWLDGATITQTTARIAVNAEFVDPSYLALVLTGPVGRRSVEMFAKGAAQPGLNLEHVKLFLVPIPPIGEQRLIVERIESETAPFKQLITDALSAVELLEERRAALISAAVTGKIDVRSYPGGQAEAA